MIAHHAEIIERCANQSSPLASDPPARPFGAQTGNLPYSRTVVNNVGFVDHYPINDSFLTSKVSRFSQNINSKVPKKVYFFIRQFSRLTTF